MQGFENPRPKFEIGKKSTKERPLLPENFQKRFFKFTSYPSNFNGWGMVACIEEKKKQITENSLGSIVKNPQLIFFNA